MYNHSNFSIETIIADKRQLTFIHSGSKFKQQPQQQQNKSELQLKCVANV